ncbi:MAG: HEPN domain-containing protein [Acidobacteria bacterium]|nr:HEPN domain-containing protein [Acidobacteriota bacterium]
MTNSWIVYADGSYIATRLLWFTSRQLDSAVLAHHTVELYLKAFLVSNGVSIRPGSEGWGHGLIKLNEACCNYSTEFSSRAISRRVSFFDRYFELVRYPSKLDSLKDGQMIWFSFDANIQPLDEVVAFVRPRVRMTTEDWESTEMFSILSDSSDRRQYQHRALLDQNPLIKVINCRESGGSSVPFNENFSYDLPGC